jgi:replicative DNA helicase
VAWQRDNNNSDGLDRVPPQDIDAEQATLGSMLLEPGAATRAFAIVEAQDFYLPQHQALCHAILNVANRNEPVDLVTVGAELRRQGKLEDLGGGEYLTSLIGLVPTAAHISRYANIVAEKAVLRRLIEAGSAIQALGFENPDDVGGALDRSEQRIFEIARRRMGGDFTPVAELLDETLDKLDGTLAAAGETTGVPTSLSGFNQLTSGLQPGDLVIIAGRPSMGKTSLAINSLAVHAAVRSDVPVGVFSLEMSKLQLAEMMLCGLARVNSFRLKRGGASDDDWSRIVKCLDYLSKAPIYIDDTPGISILELRSKARRIKTEYDIGLIVIDYLQLCTAAGFERDASRHQEIGHIARSLKALARELHIPVVVLSQLSRTVERREDKRPILSDLAESGSIEAEADLVAFLYRQVYYDRKKQAEEAAKRKETQQAGQPAHHDTVDQAELIIAKHRNGPVGTVDVMFDSSHRLFHDVAAPREDTPY